MRVGGAHAHAKTVSATSTKVRACACLIYCSSAVQQCNPGTDITPQTLSTCIESLRHSAPHTHSTHHGIHYHVWTATARTHKQRHRWLTCSSFLSSSSLCLAAAASGSRGSTSTHPRGVTQPASSPPSSPDWHSAAAAGCAASITSGLNMSARWRAVGGPSSSTSSCLEVSSSSSSSNQCHNQASALHGTMSINNKCIGWMNEAGMCLAVLHKLYALGCFIACD